MLREEGGWNYHLLTEDIEFSIASAVRGRKIGYCGNAIIYDEQPEHFRQSWDQRLRWSKGFYQVDAKYTGALLRGCTRGGKAGMSCYDMLMTVAPCNLVTIGSLLLAVLLCVTSFAQPAYITYRVMRMLGRILMLTVRGITFSLFAFGAVTMIAEWKHIAGPAWKKVLYTFTFRSSCSPMFRFRSPLWSARSSGNRSSMASQGAGGTRERVMPPRGWGKRGRGNLRFPFLF